MGNKLVRNFAIGVVIGVALMIATKLVWQSGFDQGSDVTLCVIASMENDGKFAASDDGCKRAKAYERNPLWLLRRRNGDQNR